MSNAPNEKGPRQPEARPRVSDVKTVPPLLRYDDSALGLSSRL
jgi:hypothetical protein